MTRGHVSTMIKAVTAQDTALTLASAAELFAREVGAPTRTPCDRCGCTTYQPYDDYHECENCGLPFGDECPDEDLPLLVSCVEHPNLPTATIRMRNSCDQSANVVVSEAGEALTVVYIAPCGATRTNVPQWWRDRWVNPALEAWRERPC